MIQKIVDKQHHFISMFNPKTSAYVRTGILAAYGFDAGVIDFASESNIKFIET